MTSSRTLNFFANFETKTREGAITTKHKHSTHPKKIYTKRDPKIRTALRGGAPCLDNSKESPSKSFAFKHVEEPAGMPKHTNTKLKFITAPEFQNKWLLIGKYHII